MKAQLISLRTGGDPRTLSEFSELKNEMHKQFHPARPDVDWEAAQVLCLTIFTRNGVDLRTAAWYALVRLHQDGITGLNDGLQVIAPLIEQHWQTFWPHQTHARIEILADFTRQAIAGMRGITPVYNDLSALYQAESLLAQLCQTLERLELKHLTQSEKLHSLVYTLAYQLENADSTNSADEPFITPEPSVSPVIPVLISAASHQVPSPAPLRGLNQNDIAPAIRQKKIFRRGIIVGLLSGIILSSVIVSATVFLQSPPVEPLTSAMPYLPDFDATTKNILAQHLVTDSVFNNEALNTLAIQLRQNGAVSPVWFQLYGKQLTDYLLHHYSEESEVKNVVQEWQKTIETNAVPENKLIPWSEGMAQLDALSKRLDTLDSKPRSYITGSELKSVIFNARQYFYRGIPLEEELRLLALKQQEGAVSEAEYQKIDTHFQQLLNRYALIRFSGKAD